MGDARLHPAGTKPGHSGSCWETINRQGYALYLSAQVERKGSDMATKDNPGTGDAKTPEADAKGQYRKLLKSSDNDGLHSARPRVVTGSEDATLDKKPAGEKEAGKDWDVNYDPADMNEGKFRG